MRECKNCVLPETYSGIEFDEKGVCNYCNDFMEKKNSSQEKLYFKNEDELTESLKKYKGLRGKYDVLVPLSGGVDSSVALINIVEKFKLRPLVFHNDHGYEDETATDNVRKLCRELNVDMILWQHDFTFMKKLWKYFNECNIHGLNACYVCGNILYLNALELAANFNIPLIINGYSKGQATLIGDQEKGSKQLEKMIEVIRNTRDMEFFEEFARKYELLGKQKIFKEPNDLTEGINAEKILIIPFYIFKFYKTDKEVLKKICMDRFDWNPLKTTYPARTTNCEMIWLNTYMDIRKMNYSAYTDEYSTLIREGEISREQAAKDLEFNPPEGLLDRLARDIGIDLNNIESKSGINEDEEKITNDFDIDFNF